MHCQIQPKCRRLGYLNFCFLNDKLFVFYNVFKQIQCIKKRTCTMCKVQYK